MKSFRFKSKVNVVEMRVGTRGPAGEQGPPGTGLTILGTVANESALPTDAEVGDGYLIDGELWIWQATEEWLNVGQIQGPPGDDGADGADGADGRDGREIELQTTATHVQWRYVGAATWTNLIAISVITGPAGQNGDDGAPGIDGSEVELQATSTHIQWRYVGSATWTNLVALSAITGPAGADGDNGLSAYQVAVANGFTGTEAAWLASLVGRDGEVGMTGANGQDGASAYQIAVNNGFPGSESDWLLSLEGADGADGTNGVGVPTGGTTGQVLAKSSNTDYATEWIDQTGGSGTPDAHAASHVTGGTDKIRDATASQDGLATAAQITKLDGIESGADVTDAGNVGGAIHGASAKTTPVDADTVALIDSAASNGLKKLSWANIKATLKTYFDTLYNLYVLPAPTTTALGGVKRNEGSAGQFVNGVASDGQLQYGTPGGGGGGKVAQVVMVSDSTSKSTSSQIPLDNTMPQQSEGAAYTELDVSFTPINPSSTLFIEVLVKGSINTVATAAIALFKDSDANALESDLFTSSGAAYLHRYEIQHKVVTAGSGARTYKVRFGPLQSAIMYLNTSSGTPYLGGTVRSSIKITEVLP